VGEQAVPSVPMTSSRYLALLRGINVGGRNKVAMADLRATFEEHGFTAVRTYIQSGNVVFESTEPATTLESVIEPMLERRLGMPLVAVVRSESQLRAVVDDAPPGFGTAPDTYHSDAIFLKQPLTAEQAMRVVSVRDGVDEAWPGHAVVYFARLSARRTQSRMGKIVGTPEYRLMTIRSWTTTTKLLAMFDELRAETA
jgi:uncharacterized protein (DUF1697 family)